MTDSTTDVVAPATCGRCQGTIAPGRIILLDDVYDERVPYDIECALEVLGERNNRFAFPA